MKTLQLSIITIIGIALIGTISLIVISQWQQGHVPKSDTVINSQESTITIYPGSMPQFTCTTGSVFANVSILKSSGFMGVYHVNFSRFIGDDYVLEPGHQGNITLTIKIGDKPQSNLNYPAKENITNTEGFFHETSSPDNMLLHQGVIVLYEPKSVMVGFNSSVTVNMKIFVKPDASRGTYWLYLPPGGCGGGVPILFTVGNNHYQENNDRNGEK